MLAQLEKPTNDFAALASYLVHGKEQPASPDRVAWVLTRNLPTDDPMIAAQYMAATAQLSRRCQHAAYHAMIAWSPEEHPSPEVMQQIAVATLELAGLAEHQALIMGHGDKPHAHLHMLINRVHPETGRAWSTSHDYRRFDAIMRQLAGEHGFRYVPAHQFDPELTDDMPRQPGSAATYAARHGAATARPQWSRKDSRAFGARMSERLDRASSWEDVEAAFAEQGLALEAKGRGLVVGDAGSYTKLSALGLAITAKGLGKKFGRPYRRPPERAVPGRQHSRPVFTVDAIDIARAIGTHAELQSTVQDAIRARKARMTDKPLLDRLMAELAEQWRARTSMQPPQRRGTTVVRGERSEGRER